MRIKAISVSENVIVPAGGSASQSFAPNMRVNKIAITLGANTSITSLTISGKSYPTTATVIDVGADFGAPAEIQMDISLSNAGTADEAATIEFDGVTE